MGLDIDNHPLSLLVAEFALYFAPWEDTHEDVLRLRPRLLRVLLLKLQKMHEDFVQSGFQNTGAAPLFQEAFARMGHGTVNSDSEIIAILASEIRNFERIDQMDPRGNLEHACFFCGQMVEVFKNLKLNPTLRFRVVKAE